MVLAASQKWPFVINLGNSIIGVAVLAMPFCFKQCGILLGALVLLFCTWLTLASCQLLVKAGIMSHYQSYEFLAYHTYGAPGKFLVEMGLIGMQLGTLVAQIVVIGDLGPPIISHLFGFENNWKTRMYLIIVLCLFVGLPLGLMKDLRNVSRASTICITFYAVFVVYCLWMASGNLLKGEWYSHVNLWRPQGFFQCLPIMSFSFGCQTQLFILYDALPEPSLQAIKGIIHSAVNLCAVTYLLVGFFGYVAFYHLDIPGDIITVFPGTLTTHLIKLGFVMSIAITFPVIIFPCRASLYTLLFQKDFEESFETHVHSSTRSKHSDIATSTYIPEHLFKAITIAIVMGSMITGILIPNVEFVLGLNGAITGTLICYIFPALFFLRVSKPEGKTIAQIVLALGVAILLVSTFTTLNAQDRSHTAQEVQSAAQEAADRVKLPADDLPHNLDKRNDKEAVPHIPKENALPVNGNRRLEPPYPFAPADEIEVDKNAKPAKADKQADKESSAQKAEKEPEDEKQKLSDQGMKNGEKKEEKEHGQPHEEKAAASQNLVGVKQDQKVANRPPTVEQQGQGPVNQAGGQGDNVANNLPVVAQDQNNANQPQVLAPDVNAANQSPVLVQAQNQPQALAQGQDKADQPQAVVQDQGVVVNQPPVVVKQGVQVNQPQGVVQQGPGGPAQGEAPAAQQNQAFHLQQDGSLKQGQGVVAQQQAAALQPDKAMLGQQQKPVFQDRDILADRGAQADQPAAGQQGMDQGKKDQGGQGLQPNVQKVQQQDVAL